VNLLLLHNAAAGFDCAVLMPALVMHITAVADAPDGCCCCRLAQCCTFAVSKLQIAQHLPLHHAVELEAQPIQ
jgi:hypothetical protein